MVSVASRGRTDRMEARSFVNMLRPGSGTRATYSSTVVGRFDVAAERGPGFRLIGADCSPLSLPVQNTRRAHWSERQCVPGGHTLRYPEGEMSRIDRRRGKPPSSASPARSKAKALDTSERDPACGSCAGRVDHRRTDPERARLRYARFARATRRLREPQQQAEPPDLATALRRR
jgi:hypothetical protein